MMGLWITRDTDSQAIYSWDVQPIYHDGEWDKKGARLTVQAIAVTFVKAFVGDLWFDDGQFCFEIEVLSVKRIRTQPETIVQKLRGKTGDYCSSKTLLEAADLIESLSK